MSSIGWTDPEGRRPRLGALLLAYYDPDGRLIYAGRVGTGIDKAELERLWRQLQPLATTRCRSTCRRRARPASDRRWCSAAFIGCGRELVAEVKFLTWTDDNLLRQVVYEGLREDKPAKRGAARGAASENRLSGAPVEGRCPSCSPEYLDQDDCGEDRGQIHPRR